MTNTNNTSRRERDPGRTGNNDVRHTVRRRVIQNGVAFDYRPRACTDRVNAYDPVKLNIVLKHGVVSRTGDEQSCIPVPLDQILQGSCIAADCRAAGSCTEQDATR